MSYESASKMLKVTGILCIIGGSISILSSLFVGLIGGLISAASLSVAGAALGFVAIFAAIIAMLGGVFELVTGILGVKNCNNPPKVKTCFILGIISIVITAISFFSSLSSGFNIMNLVSFVLPILYTVAAYFVKKAQVM